MIKCYSSAGIEPEIADLEAVMLTSTKLTFQ